MDIKEEVRLLSKGCVDIIPEKGLFEKLKECKEDKRPLVVKFGADPSAPDIHLGHTVPIRKLKQFQDLGHTVIFLIGDFTGMIGDPSGKTSTRKQLTKEEVLINAESYKEQIFKILDPEKTVIKFNSQWCSDMNFEDVLKLTSHYTVARLLERDDFSKRYNSGSPISVLEFMYPLIQGYDSVALKADIEIGGTDQTFNLLVGRNLQQGYGQKQQVVMTLPIIEGTDGVNKMSKSLNNYIGVEEDANNMFGKVMSIPDNLIIKYFELLTDKTPDEIDGYKAIVEKQNPRDAKVLLAKEIVSIYHNSEAADEAFNEFEKRFGKAKKNALPEDVGEIKLEGDQIRLLDFIRDNNFAPSGAEAKRIIKQGGVVIFPKDASGADDGIKINDIGHVLKIESGVIIKIGKKTFVKLA
jgi:tyrosyl-tRNA synthetase